MFVHIEGDSGASFWSNGYDEKHLKQKVFL